MKKLLIAALLMSAPLSVVACNTIEGVGKDVKATGEVVEKVAKDVKEDITD